MSYLLTPSLLPFAGILEALELRTFFGSQDENLLNMSLLECFGKIRSVFFFWKAEVRENVRHLNRLVSGLKYIGNSTLSPLGIN